MFGGSYSAWLKEYDIRKNSKNLLPIFNALQKEFIPIMDIIYDSNPAMVKDLQKLNKLKKKGDQCADKHAERRTVIAMWAQTLERFIQELAVSWLVDSKNVPLESVVPCQDGFMILKKYDYPELKDDIRKAVFMELDINIDWLAKPFDEAITIPDCKLEFGPSQQSCEIVLANDDKTESENVIQLQPHWKYSMGILYAFDEDTGL